MAVNLLLCRVIGKPWYVRTTFQTISFVQPKTTASLRTARYRHEICSGLQGKAWHTFESESMRFILCKGRHKDDRSSSSRPVSFQGFKGLKSLILSALFGLADKTGANPIWPHLEYAGMSSLGLVKRGYP